MTEDIKRDSLITDSLLTERQTLTEREEVAPQEAQTKSKVRIKSIDIYRGLTMVGMIMVDNLGPSKNPPAWLDHPDWHGLTCADFIFPAFLFIMGMAVPLAVSPKRPAKPKNFIRIVGLFLIGFMLNLIAKKFNFDVVRILGILQRLAICYGLILCYHLATNYGQSVRRKFGAILMLILYIVYLCLMITFEGGDEPGCSKQLNLTDPCNIAGYIDRKILTRDHIYRRWYTDPQGIYSTIGALITTYMGYQYSSIMSTYKENPQKLAFAWLSISFVLGAVTYPMTLAFPFNKKLYTPSFILVVGSVSGVALTFFYFLVDILPTIRPRSKKVIQTITAPLLWLGLNPLAIFVMMDIFRRIFVNYIEIDGDSLWTQFFNHTFGSWIDNDTISALAMAFFFVLLWMIVAGVMYRFKVYVRL